MTQVFARLADWLSPIVYLSSNWISRTGVFLVTSAVIMEILLLPGALRETESNAYFGILTFLILPALLFFGLLLIPAGIAWQRSRLRRQQRVAEPAIPRGDWFKLFRFIAVATVINVIIGGYASVSAIHYMESNSFCGTACHVMQPEFTAHGVGNHSNVACVSCHVGPGAVGFIEAKMGGIRQLLLLAADRYSRPIPGAANRMEPVAERCELCHSQFANAGDRLWVKHEYTGDRENTPATTVLSIHTGKIHAAHTWSDCLTCHNRPAHTFETPEGAVDAAITSGAISRELPFARQQGVEIVQREFASRDAAASEIPAAFARFYQQVEPEAYAQQREAVDRAGSELAAIYARNVFPDMRVKWKTYENRLGHTQSTGCFACHDGSALTQDCSTCHSIVTMSDPAPAVLEELGMAAQ